MPDDDPETHDAMAAHTGSSRRGLAVDRTATLVLLAAHAFLVAATLGVLGLFVMVTDPCGYRKCGDPAWISRAMVLGLGGGAAIFVATLVVAVRRLARTRTAYFVPLIGCLAQIGLAVGAAALETLAGPV